MTSYCYSSVWDQLQLSACRLIKWNGLLWRGKLIGGIRVSSGSVFPLWSPVVEFLDRAHRNLKLNEFYTEGYRAIFWKWKRTYIFFPYYSDTLCFIWVYRIYCLFMGHFSWQIFRGNNDQNSIKIQALTPPVYGRFIRIHPWSWYRHISMRVEFYGCKTGQLGDFFLYIFLKGVLAWYPMPCKLSTMCFLAAL